MIDLVALITPGIEPGSSGDLSSAGIEGDRPQLARHLGQRHDVDTRDGQEPHVGSPDHAPGHFPLDPGDLPALGLASVLQVAEDLLAELGDVPTAAGVGGPGEDWLDGRAPESDPGLACELLDARPSRLADRLGGRQVLWNQKSNFIEKQITKTLFVSRKTFVD